MCSVKRRAVFESAYAPADPRRGRRQPAGPAQRRPPEAVRALTTIEREGVLQRISYADLSVEEMGSVYESLLDYTPQIAAHEEQVGERTFRRGEFYPDPRQGAQDYRLLLHPPVAGQPVHPHRLAAGLRRTPAVRRAGLRSGPSRAAHAGSVPGGG